MEATPLTPEPLTASIHGAVLTGAGPVRPPELLESAGAGNPSPTFQFTFSCTEV